MDFLDNEYKKRFQNKHLSDDKIDAEDLWAAIEQNLDISVSKPVGYLNWLKKYRLTIIVIALFLCPILMYQWVNLPKKMLLNTSSVVDNPKKQDSTNNIEDKVSNYVDQQTSANTPSVNSSKNSLDNKENVFNYVQQQTSANTPSVNQDKNSLNNKENAFNYVEQQTSANTPSVNSSKNSLNNKENVFNYVEQQTSANTPSVNLSKNSLDNKENAFNYVQQQTLANTPSVNSSKNSLDNKENVFNYVEQQTSANTPSVNQDKNTSLIVNNKNLLSKETSVLSEDKHLSIVKTLADSLQTAEMTIQHQLSANKDSVERTNLLFPFLKSQINAINIGKPLLERVDMITNVKKKQKTKAIKGQLAISTGLNTLKVYYLSDSSVANALIKNKTEKEQLGWNSNVHVTLLWHNKWRLNSGIMYAQYHSKLDYKEEKTVQVLKKNQLLQVWINTNTGDTLQTRRGDTIINARLTREVTHYNEFKQLSIPITVGFQNQSKHWIYGINAGAVWNFTLAQSGRLLDDKGTFQLFSNGNPIAPLRKSSIGTQISPFIGYAMTKKWSIECHPQWLWQFNKTIGTTNMKAHIHQFGLNIHSVWQL